MTRGNIPSTPKSHPESGPSHQGERHEVHTQTQNELNEVKRDQEILQELDRAKGSEARVRCFARLADTYGLETLVSLIPGAGDATSSVLSGLYLLCEAKRAGLSTTSYLKIIGLQAADFFIGAIPMAGDVADYLFQANKWSASLFQERTKELVKQATEAGVSSEEIAKITQAGERLPQLVDAVTKIYPAKKAA